MNDKADFSDHVNFVTTQIKQRASWILRSFRRNSGVEDFKIKIDQFLSQITDQPVIGTLVPTTCDPP